MLHSNCADLEGKTCLDACYYIRRNFNGHSKSVGIMKLVPFCSNNSLHSSGKAFHKASKVLEGFLPAFTKACVRPGTDVCQISGG